MRAITFHRYGAPDDVLRLSDVDEPEVADDGVLVEVHASSVNPADWHIIRANPAMARLQFGLRKPKFRVPGCDVAGRVIAVGNDVTMVRPGDDVFASSFMHGFGAFAERVAIPERLVAHKPTSLTFGKAAAVPLAAMTALQGLRDHGHVGAGDKVLVIGSSGGVGTFAVQIAKALGAEVTGVCSTRNTDLVRSLGADHVIDYTTTDVTSLPDRYDQILQLAGTHAASALRRILTTNGTLVQISGDSRNRVVGPLGRIISGRVLSRFVSQTITSFTVQPRREDLEQVSSLVEEGKVTPVIDPTYSLDDIPAAIRHLEGGGAHGKVVVAVRAETAGGNRPQQPSVLSEESMTEG